MADDRIDQFENLPSDWVAVAAVGLVGYIRFGNQKNPVRKLLDRLDAGSDDLDCDLWCTNRALREAYEAGLREGEVVGESRAVDHITSAEAEFISELRRELAARRAVDGWLRADSCRSLRVTDWGDVCATIWEDGHERIVAMKADYPALAAALGLEVEDE